MTTLVIFHVVCPVVYPNLTFQHRYFAQYILLLETGGKAKYCCMSSPSQRVVVNRSVISCCSWLDVNVDVSVDVSVGVHVAVDVDVVVYVDVGG